MMHVWCFLCFTVRLFSLCIVLTVYDIIITIATRSPASAGIANSPLVFEVRSQLQAAIT